MPDIRLVLDLSTAHLPEDLGTSGLSSLDGVVAYPLDFGWLLWVPEDPDADNGEYDHTIPATVLAIQRYARSHQCDYVLIDRDGPHNPDLPQWSW